MFNSLVITLNGTRYVFECHSHAKAIEILAHNWNLWQSEGKSPIVDSFELV